MTEIIPVGHGWFRRFGALFVRGERTYHVGRSETEYAIGLHIGPQSFELAVILIRYAED